MSSICCNLQFFYFLYELFFFEIGINATIPILKNLA